MALLNGDGNLPTWVSAVLLRKLLEDTVPDFERVTRTAVISNTTVLSRMLRLRVEVQLKDGKSKTLAYRLGPAGSAEDVFSQLGILQTPAPLDSAEAQPQENLYQDLVLFDDQQAKGYKNVHPAAGLDVRHTQAALQQLAAFHASSALNLAGAKNDMRRTHSSAQLAKYQQSSALANRQFHESLRSYNLRRFEDQIKSYQQQQQDLIGLIGKVDALEFNVLLHGACSSHNVLFQYDAFGNIKDTLLIDFQMRRVGSPIKDLLYFLLSSTRWEEKLGNFDFYLKYYHDHLVANLKSWGYAKSMPSLTDLHLAVLKYSQWSFAVITKILPVVLLEPTPNDDIELGDLLKQMYTNPSYAKQIEHILPWMENRGYLEI